MTVTERVAYFIKAVTVADIMQRTSLKQSNLYRVSEGKPFNIEVIEQLVTGYPTLNAEWLLFGIGEIWKHSNKSEIYSDESETLAASEPAPNYGKTTEGGILERMQQEIAELKQAVELLNQKMKDL
jgi:hypothetical protein